MLKLILSAILLSHLLPMMLIASVEMLGQETESSRRAAVIPPVRPDIAFGRAVVSPKGDGYATQLHSVTVSVNMDDEFFNQGLLENETNGQDETEPVSELPPPRGCTK